MSKKDYYELLGVGRNATEQELKSAYKRLAIRHHPDKNPGDAAAEETFKEVAEAYGVLSNAEQRARYDRFGHAGVSGSAGAGNWGAQGFGGIEDILGDLFGFGDVFGGRAGGGGSGGRRSSAQRGTQPETCATCNGAGQVRYQQGFFSVARTCGACRGTGRIIKNPCATCKGAGRTERERQMEVKVPAGVETGSRLRITGEGEGGASGGSAGDLYVVIHVKEHEQFERQGSNLYAAVPVTFAQAALGSEIMVQTLNGEQALKIPAGTQTGTVFRLKGQGMPVLGGRGHGDLFVSVALRTPTTLTREQRRLLEELSKIEDRDLEDKGLIDRVRDIFG